MRSALILLMTMALAGCTIVQIDGPANVSRVYPGVLKIEPSDDVNAVIYSAEGLGLVPGQHGLTLGYSNESVVAVKDPSQCIIVLLEPKEENIQNLVDQLGALLETDQKVCLAGGIDE